MPPQPTARDPLTGHPRYHPMGALSSGSFGFVRRYRNVEDDTCVAIKFLQRGEKITKYIASEVLNHRILCHSHVIGFREVFLTEDYICIVMEYADVGTLFSFVQKAGRLQEKAARWFFQQLIIGLDYCHRKGVVNRDIKLENTLLSILTSGLSRACLQSIPNLPLPLVKIADFGYSKSDCLSAPTSKVGTLACMAPEVISSTGNYDGKLADIWSCGVMLYTMLFGRYPFDVPRAAAPQCGAQPAAAEGKEAADGAAAEAAGEVGGEGQQQDRRTKLLIERIINSRWDVPESIPITDACRDLLMRLLMADPAQRLTMAEIQRHPWFVTDLPPGALQMNDNYLADTTDTSGLQSEEDVKAILSKAQSVKDGAMSGLEDDHNGVYEDMIDEAFLEEEAGKGSSNGSRCMQKSQEEGMGG